MTIIHSLSSRIMPFLSAFLSLPSGRKVHYIYSRPEKATKTPIVATHGLGRCVY